MGDRPRERIALIACWDSAFGSGQVVCIYFIDRHNVPAEEGEATDSSAHGLRGGRGADPAKLVPSSIKRVVFFAIRVYLFYFTV